jgi:hypothetical protein
MTKTTRTKGAAMQHIRWTIGRDLPGVIAVDRANGLGTTEAEYEKQLKQRSVIGMVAETGHHPEHVVGHFLYRLTSEAVVLLALRVLPGVSAGPLVEKLLYKRDSHRRPVLAIPVAAECRTDTVRQVARAVAAGTCVPAILADALDDADCRQQWLLAELRGDKFSDALALAVAHGLNYRPE